MSTVETLYKNKWIEVLEKTTDVNGKYVYTHSGWNNGVGVALVPYKIENNEMKILGRYEICPAHSDEVELCSITGGWDNMETHSIVECAVGELKEEGGYLAKPTDLMSLGVVKASKSSDTDIYLFAVDITHAEACEAVSDGTLGEIGAYCDWIEAKQAMFCKDPLLGTMMMRLVYELYLK